MKIKKCEKCHVPLSGWRFKYIVRPFIGIMPVKGKNICNKCDNKTNQTKFKIKNKNGKK